MSKVLTFFIILFSSLGLISCGVKRNSNKDVESNKAYINAIMLSNSCGGSSVGELDVEIIKLEDSFKTIKFIKPLLNIQKKKKVIKKKDLDQTILSKSLLSKRIKSIQMNIDQISETDVTFKEYSVLSKKLKKLRIDFDRWSFHQCHLTDLVDNNDEEINDFIELESYICEDDCFNFLSTERYLSEEEKRDKTINICSLSSRKNKCRVEYDISLIYGDEDQYIKKTLKEAKSFFTEEIFGMEDTPLEIECVNAKTKEISIPIFQNENSVSLINAISQNWKKDDVKINFNLGDRGVRLELVEKGLSRVYSNKLNTIYLNKNISGVERVKTIAHEFGHTLGFKDCYIEYFDTKKEEVVYYELEREKGNLMCSLEYGTNIPEKYLEKVVSKYCK